MAENKIVIIDKELCTGCEVCVNSKKRINLQGGQLIMAKKTDYGFTLIELMVVIVILGILAAVMVPRVPKLIAKSVEGKTKGNLGALRSTLNIYYGDNEGRYPADSLECLLPKYLKEIPECEIPGAHAKTSTVSNGSVVGNSDAGNWQYNKNIASSSWGNIWVECQHKDSAGNYWSNY